MATSDALAGRRVLVTGAARGIGAALAVRLAERGAGVALLGLEPDALAATAARAGGARSGGARSGGAPWFACDVTDRAALEDTVERAVDALGGLDVVVANAGVAAQLPLVGGDPYVWDRTLAVNLTGVYDTVRLAGPHLSHPQGYALLVSSLAAAVHLPLMGAYSASKAGVEALGNALRLELAPSGARVGVAYFGELDTDMTSRGFGTEAASTLVRGTPLGRVAPLEHAIDALERGVARRSRVVASPRFVRAALPARGAVQRGVERTLRRSRVRRALQIARHEGAGLTTPQPSAASAPDGHRETA
ncbi:SDR family NAD(P)-dependent oxidoreductase [Mumia zhuanghuii]|uniref:SDR family NAD(P)-dependent oxidoreductase n=1 Tax=Mumia zhuanghuii TaxID=2585211 RepID=UPI001E47313B|nr:SDR family NAD(P)-dependent oxidoreductase [Mumia zhuanghuii]